ncbi:MAG: hypothetical protein AB7P40_02455 [Chloroflexota bacterium]
MQVEYLAGALVVIAVLAFVALPLVRRQREEQTTVSPLVEAANERATIYRELVELELDHRIGKITAADFKDLSDGLLARAAGLITAEEAVSVNIDEQVEREIAAMREALRLSPSATLREVDAP